MSKLLVIGIIALFSFQLFAGEYTLNCSNADKSVQYKSKKNQNTGTLKFNGKKIKGATIFSEVLSKDGSEEAENGKIYGTEDTAHIFADEKDDDGATYKVFAQRFSISVNRYRYINHFLICEEIATP